MRRVMENQSLPTPSVRASSLINPLNDDDNAVNLNLRTRSCSDYQKRYKCHHAVFPTFAFHYLSGSFKHRRDICPRNFKDIFC